jgi:hypothetical protein
MGVIHMAKTALTVKMQIEGVRETLRAFSVLPKEAQDALRDRSEELSKQLATKLKVAAIANGPQSGLMAPTIKAKRDRVPAVQAGGTRKVGSNKKPAYKILFGSEFGSNNLDQFRPHQADGYWFFQTVRRDEGGIAKAWVQMADDVAAAFARGDIG